MSVLTIETNQQSVLQLLLELDQLKLLHIIKKEVPEPMAKKTSLSAKYRGKLSAELTFDLQNHLTQSRNEWERNF